MEDKYTTEIDYYGKYWYKNGELHRDDDLPAIERTNGTKKWLRNGELHRDNGPAIEYYDGTKEWCRDGKLHRDDGPAMEYTSGTKYYYLDGEEFTEEDYYEYMKEIDDLPLEIQLTHEKEWVRERAKKNGR